LRGKGIDVIVIDDGTPATRNRTDVRIMKHFKPITKRPKWSIGQDRHWAAGTPPHARRTASPTLCLFCGEQTSRLSASDLASDHGRIRLRCTNPRCAVIDAEVIVLRDATVETSQRPDVTALSGLEPVNFGKPERRPGEVRFYSVKELKAYASQFDALQLRTSGPVPWE
jgi:hypothetical protein